MKLLYWLPRILAIAFAMFLGLFAFDVFGEGYSFIEAIFAFVIHLVPTWLVLAALLFAWRWERLGGLLFVALGVAYIFVARFDFPASLIIAGPTFLIAILFLLHAGLLTKTNAQRRML